MLYWYMLSPNHPLQQWPQPIYYSHIRSTSRIVVANFGGHQGGLRGFELGEFIRVSFYLGPLHLTGFENRMEDSPFYYRKALAQLERQKSAYVPF